MLLQVPPASRHYPEPPLHFQAAFTALPTLPGVQGMTGSPRPSPRVSALRLQEPTGRSVCSGSCFAYVCTRLGDQPGVLAGNTRTSGGEHPSHPDMAPAPCPLWGFKSRLGGTLFSLQV